MSRRSTPLYHLAALALVGGMLGALVLPAAPATAAQSVADMTFLGKDREPSGAPDHFVGVGLPGGVRFFDGDLPPDVVRWGVRVHSTSDPLGLLVLTRRAMRASAYYEASFRFSTRATNQATQELLVADGDTVTFSYLDATTAGGAPRMVEVTTIWRAGSAQPDSRSLVFSTADPDAPVVLGEYHAVAPSATVRVYAASTGGTPIGTGQADVKGTFSVRVPRLSPVPTKLWVAVTEGAEGESVRAQVWRAALIGRVLHAQPEATPVTSAGVWIRPPGTPSPCEGVVGACGEGGTITYRGGRFAAVVGNSPVTSPGPYDLNAAPSGSIDREFMSPWSSSAYGKSATVRTTVSDMEVTADAGDIRLTPPNFFARVTGEGIPVPEAQIWVESPGGETLPGGGYTRPDGRTALFFPDGDYRLWVRPPIGCAGYVDRRTGVISVRGGVATPSTIDIDLGPGSGGGGTTLTVPVAGGWPVAVELSAPAAPVSLLIEGTSGQGYVSAGCRSALVPDNVTAVGPGVQLVTPGLRFSSVRVCLGYTDDQVAAAGVDPARLELFHLGDGGHADVITSTRDLIARQVCGTTTSFSGFVLGVRNAGGAPSTPPPSATAPAPTPSTPPPSATAPAPTTPARAAGYWMAGADGAVYAFGAAPWLGTPRTTTPAADIEPTPTGRGYWVVDEAGGVHSFGDAVWAGQAGSLARGEKVTSLSASPTARGYWLFTTLGRALAFGDAPFLGDMAGVSLNGPVLDSIPTPTGRGYYMVAADGGIFAFGDAAFHGSMGGARLNAPVQSLVPDSDGAGYWLVASDGGVFAFQAPFRGSMGATRLNDPVTGMVRYGNGYLMVGTDGGIFNFSDRPFLGSLGDRPPARPVVSVASLP